jgi:cob(I)alamin adenosyltransferase
VEIEMKIYTKQGDSGKTGLVGGQRVPKDIDRIEAYGTLDELSSMLGLVGALPSASSLLEILRHIQTDLFVMGAQLATPAPAVSSAGTVEESDVRQLEAWIDQFSAELPTLQHFVLPGGSLLAAQLHVARVVCRRAERRTVTLATAEPIGERLVPYLNRLSDLLFVLARWANAMVGIEDVRWIGRSREADNSS